MQTKLFPLFDDTNDVLRITHDTAFQYCKIAVNEREIGVIENKKALESGLNYDLGIQGGDNHLQIKLLKKYFLFPQLQVLVNGEAVENSDTYPETQFKW